MASRSPWHTATALRRPILSVCLVVVCFGLGIQSTVRQTTSTTIQGAVIDSSSAVLAGAKVTAVNTKTGIRRETVATSTGDYTFRCSTWGCTSVTVEANGFRPKPAATS